MHAMTFQVKRLHWRSVAFGMKVVERVPDMTPARFDLLYALHTISPSGLRQDTLRRVLGVSSATVSRMIKQLASFGWLRKERALDDARTNNIGLTGLGRQRIERAMRIVFRQRTHLGFFERFFKDWDPRRHVLQAIGAAWTTIEQIGRALGDQSTLEFDFGWRDVWPNGRTPESRVAAPEVVKERMARHAECVRLHAVTIAAGTDGDPCVRSSR